MSAYRITFRYEPTPDDLMHIPGSDASYSKRERLCVYEFLDASGRHLYIGASSHLVQRIGHHEKNAPWYPQVAHLIVNRVASWSVIYKIEKRKILEHRPLHNVPAGTATRRRWDAYRAAKGLPEPRSLPAGRGEEEK